MIKIIEKQCDELIPYENNARINDKAVEAVAKSIKEFGMKNPIIIDTNNTIIAGHTRLKALKSLGVNTAPCIVADDLTEEQIKAFRIADNSTAQIADWDMEKLMAELETIDYDMSQYGLAEQMAEIEKIIDENKEVEDDDYEMPDDIEIRIKAGEVWQLGRHRLMCGDSTRHEDIEKLMDGNLADMVVTDPPYNVAYEGKTKDALTIENDSMSSDDFLNFLNSAFSCMYNALKEGGAFYVWFASREHINFETGLKMNDLKVREELIWVKNSMTLGRQDYQWRHEPCLYGWKEGARHNWYNDRSQTTVLEFNKPNRNDIHPTMKPVDLFAYQIKNSSKQGDLVLDLFGGSGTTLIACEQIGRKANIMEFDEKYATAIIDRWETLTGEKAVRL